MRWSGAHAWAGAVETHRVATEMSRLENKPRKDSNLIDLSNFLASTLAPTRSTCGDMQGKGTRTAQKDR